MTRIKLRVYQSPGSAEAYLSIRQKDGSFERITTIVDTGAEVTLLPASLMASSTYRLGDQGRLVVEQAGIARQKFEVTEAWITVHLEDEVGGETSEFEARV